MAQLTATKLTEDILVANKLISFSVSTGSVTSGYVATGLKKVSSAWANSIDSTTGIQVKINSTTGSDSSNGSVYLGFASADDFILTVLGI